VKTLGQLAFEAYNAAGANPGKTFDGRPVPTWIDLNDDVRAKWEEAANAVFMRTASLLTGVSA
jgi:hypothetical protein